MENVKDISSKDRVISQTKWLWQVFEWEEQHSLQRSVSRSHLSECECRETVMKRVGSGFILLSNVFPKQGLEAQTDLTPVTLCFSVRCSDSHANASICWFNSSEWVQQFCRKQLMWRSVFLPDSYTPKIGALDIETLSALVCVGEMRVRG